LVEALKEFEMGRKLARPDLLIDPEEWRISVVSRTEELNRVLDPKPRITRQGVRFKAQKLLVQPEKQRRNVEPGKSARDSNTYGEEQRKFELDAARRIAQPAATSKTIEETGAGLAVERGKKSTISTGKTSAMSGDTTKESPDGESVDEFLDIYLDEFAETEAAAEETLDEDSKDIGREVGAAISERIAPQEESEAVEGGSTTVETEAAEKSQDDFDEFFDE
jgi:hypothetical protein